MSRIGMSARGVAAALLCVLAVSLQPANAARGAAAVFGSLQGFMDARSSPHGVGIIVGEISPSGVSIFRSGSSGDRRPLDEHSLFEIGSLSKVFVGTLLATMVLDGSVRLDDPVAKYLPSSVHVPMHGGKEITLLSLATHHSGLPVLPSNLRFSVEGFRSYSLSDLNAFVSHYELKRDPGAAYEYSSAGISLLAEALAYREKTTYAKLLYRRVLAPLGMNDTSLTLTKQQVARFTVGRDANDKVVSPMVFGDGLSAATMLHSSIDDMLKYARCNMGTGPLADACLFSQEPRDRIPANKIGLAWWIDDKDAVIRHAGNSPGFHSSIDIAADRSRATIALENGGMPIDDVAWHTIDDNVPVQLMTQGQAISSPSVP